MDNNSTLLGVGVGVLAIVIGYVIYQKMGSQKPAQSQGQLKKAASNSNLKNTGTTAKQSEASGDKYPAGKLTIYFGSQTGTAEGFGRILMEEGKNTGFDAKVIDLEDFDAEVLQKSRLVIFLMATYGEGEPTDNASKFAKWMKNEDGELEANHLENVKFSVFGLGNRQYEHYNRMGKLTDKNLEALGAKRVFEYGEGDDDGTLEEDFENWRQKLWPALFAQFHPDGKGGDADTQQTKFRSLSADNIDVNHNRVKLTYNVVYGNNKKVTIPNNKISSSTKHFFTAPHAKVLVNKELRNGDVNKVGSTRHIEFDLKGTGVTYQTADNLAILPENLEENVNALARAMEYDLDDSFTLQPIDNDDFKYTFPVPCTVREVLTQYLDIQGPVKHATMKHLYPYVEDHNQREWLLKLVSKENRSHFKSYIEDSGLSLVDLLTNELSSARIPLADFMHLTQFIQPRYYTISSSSSIYPDTVHITVSITEYELKCGNGKRFTGLCSGFLKTLTAGSSCRIYNRASSFRLPTSISTPIVMIGPGTGLAPMRALLQERKYQQEHNTKKNVKNGANILYFGCKNQKVDFIYQNELQEYSDCNVLTALHTAFSRDSNKKVYVQHLLADPENAKALIDLLFNENAYIYVCGATAMGTDVMNTCNKILQEYRGMTATAATAYIKDLQEKGRYVQELWTA